MNGTPCGTPGCSRPEHSRNLCGACYRRRWRAGDFTRVPPPPRWRKIRRWWRALERDPVLFRAACLAARDFIPVREPPHTWRSRAAGNGPPVQPVIYRISCVPE